MNLTRKLLIVSGSLVAVGAIAFIIYKQIEISERQLAIESQVVKQLQLVDGIVRSQNQYATRADVEKFIKDNGLNLNAIQKDLDKLHADVSAVNTVTSHSTGYVGSNLPSTSTGPTNPNLNNVPTVNCNGKEIQCPNFDKYQYYTKQQNMTLNEPFANGVKVPIGSVGFSAWQEKPWSVEIKPREYHVTSVVGTDENQRTYFYNKFTVKVDNKEYEMNIDRAETKQIYPESKFHFWNPRLYLGLAGGVTVNSPVAEANANLQIHIMSNGKYKRQPDFTFIGLGAAYQFYNRKPAAVFTPFTYNIGNQLPLIDNTYLGPSLTVDVDGNFSVMAGISVGL